MARTKWSQKRGGDLATDLNILIGDLCVQWGFCNQLRADDLLAENGAVTADAFAAAVLTAEGMDATLETESHRALKRAFSDRYGNVASQAGYPD